MQPEACLAPIPQPSLPLTCTHTHEAAHRVVVFRGSSRRWFVIREFVWRFRLAFLLLPDLYHYFPKEVKTKNFNTFIMRIILFWLKCCAPEYHNGRHFYIRNSNLDSPNKTSKSKHLRFKSPPKQKLTAWPADLKFIYKTEFHVYFYHSFPTSPKYYGFWVGIHKAIVFIWNLKGACHRWHALANVNMKV